MRSPINVALAGIAGYGGAYLDVLLDDPRADGVRVVGAVEPAPHRCRRLGDLAARGVPIHPTLPSLFGASRVDLMLIATPILLDNAFSPALFAFIVDYVGWQNALYALLACSILTCLAIELMSRWYEGAQRSRS